MPLIYINEEDQNDKGFDGEQLKKQESNVKLNVI